MPLVYKRIASPVQALSFKQLITLRNRLKTSRSPLSELDSYEKARKKYITASITAIEVYSAGTV